MTGRAALALALLASACSIRYRPELRWVGQLTPIPAAAGCAPSRGVLLMRENDVVFTPDEGTWTLYGTAQPGTLTAAAGRVGADKKPYETTLEARWTETDVAGTYTTPRCTYKVALTRK